MSCRARDLEPLEAVGQDELIRGVLLRLAALARGDRLDGFIAAVGPDEELDDDTKATVLARLQPAAPRWLQCAPRGRLAQSVRAPL